MTLLPSIEIFGLRLGRSVGSNRWTSLWRANNAIWCGSKRRFLAPNALRRGKIAQLSYSVLGQTFRACVTDRSEHGADFGSRLLRRQSKWRIQSGDVQGAVAGMRVRSVLHPPVLLTLADGASFQQYRPRPAFDRAVGWASLAEHQHRKTPLTRDESPPMLIVPALNTGQGFASARSRLCPPVPAGAVDSFYRSAFMSCLGSTRTTLICRSRIFEAIIEICNANSSSISAAASSSRAYPTGAADDCRAGTRADAGILLVGQRRNVDFPYHRAVSWAPDPVPPHERRDRRTAGASVREAPLRRLAEGRPPPSMISPPTSLKRSAGASTSSTSAATVWRADIGRVVNAWTSTSSK